jgi:acyl carrier protein
MQSSAFARLQEISADLFNLPKERITLESSPASIECWDSLQHLNLILAIEQDFGLSLGSDEIEQMQSMGRIASLIEGKLQSTCP